MAFASLSVEDMVKIFNTVIAAFRTTIILIGREKSPNNLQVMEYMAELKIMVGLKFKGSMAQVKWKKLERFIPDAPYWIERWGAMKDDGECMTVNYDGVGEVEIPKGVHVDGTPLHGAGDQLQDGGDIRRMAIYVAVQREGDGAAQGTREH